MFQGIFIDDNRGKDRNYDGQVVIDDVNDLLARLEMQTAKIDDNPTVVLFAIIEKLVERIETLENK